MDAETILKNLDNGTIDHASAADLLAQHVDPLYIIGAYLETRKQRNDAREQLWALQDEDARPRMRQGDAAELIDHALDTDYITIEQALGLLERLGMDETTREHHIDTILAIRERADERIDYLDDPDHAARWCTRCGRKVGAGDLSNRALCGLCSADAQEENTHQLRTHKGPYYTTWRNAMLAWAYTLENEEIAERYPHDAGTLGDYIDPEPEETTGDGIPF